MTPETPWERGIRRAKEDRAKAPPPADTVDVSVSDYREPDGRRDFKLCRTCGWARPGRCTCTGTAETEGAA